MNTTLAKQGLTTRPLKWIALITMVIDHVGAAYGALYGMNALYWLLRWIGRIAFPIFAFLLVEGFFHTRSRVRYLRNLLIFAVISEVPFTLFHTVRGFRSFETNVFWTLSLGLAAMMVVEGADRLRRVRNVPAPLYLLTIVVGCAVCYLLGDAFHTDYAGMGVLLIVMIFGAVSFAAWRFPGGKTRTIQNIAACCAIVLWLLLYDLRQHRVIELYGVVCVIPLLLYNGERGNYRLAKWFYYAVYPVHLLLLTGLFVLIRDL